MVVETVHEVSYEPLGSDRSIVVPADMIPCISGDQADPFVELRA